MPIPAEQRPTSAPHFVVVSAVAIAFILLTVLTAFGVYVLHQRLATATPPLQWNDHVSNFLQMAIGNATSLTGALLAILLASVALMLARENNGLSKIANSLIDTSNELSATSNRLQDADFLAAKEGDNQAKRFLFLVDTVTALHRRHAQSRKARAGGAVTDYAAIEPMLAEIWSVILNPSISGLLLDLSEVRDELEDRDNFYSQSFRASISSVLATMSVLSEEARSQTVSHFSLAEFFRSAAILHHEISSNMLYALQRCSLVRASRRCSRRVHYFLEIYEGRSDVLDTAFSQEVESYISRIQEVDALLGLPNLREHDILVAVGELRDIASRVRSDIASKGVKAEYQTQSGRRVRTPEPEAGIHGLIAIRALKGDSRPLDAVVEAAKGSLRSSEQSVVIRGNDELRRTLRNGISPDTTYVLVVQEEPTWQLFEAMTLSNISTLIIVIDGSYRAESWQVLSRYLLDKQARYLRDGSQAVTEGTRPEGRAYIHDFGAAFAEEALRESKEVDYSGEHRVAATPVLWVAIDYFEPSDEPKELDEGSFFKARSVFGAAAVCGFGSYFASPLIPILKTRLAEDAGG